MKKKSHWCLLSAACCLLYVFSSAQLTITPGVTDVTCPGGNNGSASVSVSGGTPPYTYLWQPGGQTTSSVSGLTAGNYSVTIADDTGNDSTIIILVSQPQPISAGYSGFHLPFCSSIGNAYLRPIGGTPPYSYLWNNGQTTSAATGLAIGNYSVIVTDSNNCTATFSYDLTEKRCFVIPDPWFTPNGDNINDTWQITNAQYFDNIHLIVFDRWGTRVHEQKETYEPWDGKSYLGIPVPNAVYYYFFYQNKNDKQKESKYGSVTIMR